MEWKWEVSGANIDWETELKIWINENFPEERDVSGLLNELGKKKKAYRDNSVGQRFSIQKAIHKQLSDLITIEISAEHLFYEDVRIQRNFSLPENKIYSIIKSLDQLLSFLEPFIFDELREKLSLFWKSNFDEDTEISLLEFYELFLKQKDIEIELPRKRVGESRKKIKKLLSGIVKINNGNVDFSISDLKDIFKEHQENSKNRYATLIQFYQIADVWKGMVNGIAPGFGKLFGRFLWLCPNNVTKELQEWNNPLDQEEIWAENTDASFFNANVHPPLLNYEINVPGGQNSLPIENQIPISEIFVKWDKKKSRTNFGF